SGCKRSLYQPPELRRPALIRRRHSSIVKNRVRAGEGAHPPPGGVAWRAAIAPSRVERRLELRQVPIGGCLPAANAVGVLAELSVPLLPILGRAHARRGLSQRDMPLADPFRREC